MKRHPYAPLIRVGREEHRAAAAEFRLAGFVRGDEPHDATILVPLPDAWGYERVIVGKGVRWFCSLCGHNKKGVPVYSLNWRYAVMARDHVIRVHSRRGDRKRKPSAP